jgi:hypothetical protein
VAGIWRPCIKLQHSRKVNQHGASTCDMPSSDQTTVTQCGVSVSEATCLLSHVYKIKLQEINKASTTCTRTSWSDRQTGSGAMGVLSKYYSRKCLLVDVDSIKEHSFHLDNSG